MYSKSGFSGEGLKWLQVSSNSSQPKYLQLYDRLRQMILNGTLQQGTKLPATRSLAKTLGLSRNTVTTAYECLGSEGYIVSLQGDGHYVTQQLPDQFFEIPNLPLQSKTVALESKISQRAHLALDLHAKDQYTPPKAFAPGTPAFEYLPLETLTRLMAKQWRTAKPSQLAYSDPMGYQPLRQAIATYLNTHRGVRCRSGHILITAGAQQALDLLSQLLLDPGDCVWMEEPGYHGARGAFLSNRAKLETRAIDNEGMIFNQKAGKNPKLIYLTPSHQYPLGVTMSLPRRLEAIRFAIRHKCWIIEDDYDSEFRYQGRPLPALQGLTPEAPVIYLGTFSKVLFPSLRLGYLVLPESLVELFGKARAFRDSHPPTLTQAGIANFLTQGHFTAHLRKMRLCYYQRQQALVEAIRACASQYLWVEPTPAGMHLVAYGKTAFNDLALATLAKDHGLILRPLSSYYHGKSKRSGFVMGFSGFDPSLFRTQLQTIASLFSQLSPAKP